jgi:hypothetical protein
MTGLPGFLYFWFTNLSKLSYKVRGQQFNLSLWLIGRSHLTSTAFQKGLLYDTKTL